MKSTSNLEAHILEWRNYADRHQAFKGSDLTELEDHLRTQVESLQDAGLDEDEAFLVAVKRLGDLDSLMHEFALEYSERFWKQHVVTTAVNYHKVHSTSEPLMALALAVAAAVLIKLPELFGQRIGDADTFYVRNLALFVLPFQACYFALKRGLHRISIIQLAAPILIAAIAVNVFPFQTGGSTEGLAIIHLPLALWLLVGFAYTGGHWTDHNQRMHFIRFSGEWCIYYILIALGGGVLMGFTMFIFNAIGIETEIVVEEWILPCGVVGAVIIASWLVEAKKNIVENLAPVLTYLFTPLFTFMLLIFIGTMIWTGSGINVDRNLLIGFDLLLVLVLGLLLYAISARDPQTPPGLFDRLHFVLVISALVVDIIALWSIATRITEFGFSPNKVAALGENIILFVNLGWTAVLYFRFLRGYQPFTAIEIWQTDYLPVYVIWAWFVVIGFPVIFQFQ